MALGILPFIGLFVCVWTLASALGGGSWRRGVLRAAVLWGLYAILSLELLSLFTAVTRPMLLAVWAIPIAGLLGSRTFQLKQKGKQDWSFHWLPEGILGKILALTLVLVILITALVAWLTPPNTWDSLNYHMPRVAHWAQLQAVRHFATGIEIQNSMPPASEMMILHTYVLAQGDRWANFIAWIAVWFGVLGVTFITKELGAGKRGEWLAAAFAASLPTAIIQASSTMTDAVTGLWVIVVAVETVPLLRGQQLDWRRALFMGAAAGLAILSKPIAFAYLLPFAGYTGYMLIRHTSWRHSLVMGFAAVLLVTGINLGHWTRNYALYENPISQMGRIENHGAPWLGGRALLSNLSRNLAMHAATPSPHINKGITYLVQEFHKFIGLDVNDRRTTVTGIFKIRWGETNEDKATDPIHFYTIVVSLIAIIASGKPSDRRTLSFIAFPMLALLVFSALFQWQLYAGRFHTAFFMLMAPAVGLIWQDRLNTSLINIAGILLLLLAWPWIFQIKSRPIFTKGADAYIDSIINTPRRELYLANAPFLAEPLSRLGKVAAESTCRNIGIRLSGGSPEYLWWIWLGGVEDNKDLHWIVNGSASDHLAVDDSRLCGVLCEGCNREQQHYGEFTLVEQRASYGLYLDMGDE